MAAPLRRLQAERGFREQARRTWLRVQGVEADSKDAISCVCRLEEGKKDAQREWLRIARAGAALCGGWRRAPRRGHPLRPGGRGGVLAGLARRAARVGSARGALRRVKYREAEEREGGSLDCCVERRSSRSPLARYTWACRQDGKRDVLVLRRTPWALTSTLGDPS